MSPEKRIKHELFQAPDDILSHEGTWFKQYGEGVANLVFSHPDVALSRLLLARMLSEAWDRDSFFSENEMLEPHPDELDRMRLITWLQQTASFTGLLNGEEIRYIQKNEGRVNTSQFALETKPQPTFDELSHLTQEWRDKGQKTGLFHGAFDPVTATHLACATEIYPQCERLIIGFDSDRVLRSRKGNDRPRFPLNDRRSNFGNFWMVLQKLLLGRELSMLRKGMRF